MPWNGGYFFNSVRFFEEKKRFRYSHASVKEFHWKSWLNESKRKTKKPIENNNNPRNHTKFEITTKLNEKRWCMFRNSLLIINKCSISGGWCNLTSAAATTASLLLLRDSVHLSYSGESIFSLFFNMMVQRVYEYTAILLMCCNCCVTKTTNI